MNYVRESFAVQLPWLFKNRAGVLLYAYFELIVNLEIQFGGCRYVVYAKCINFALYDNF